ncbi:MULTISPECIES: flagellar motor protein MotB [Methylovorus]|uniref:OmpA/MotB domain protein n=1 Tax=Methylovorus glucosotrophus (strain SIP3-4) TaxID=582744 RepID=C6XBY1_METGS|nr:MULTISPECIES: flagellar motor protein MotB [Methylovorus]ACT50056.1 OmpA/MotB domain protein [Methylovorus glucosotrophus SIP3-4]ADQ84020.1 OmpA/MotB domain protein [Methylovorus sp. MP688]KAF0844599.1 chemotaxis protein MotB [Methylovorus glucosotrophus]
MAEDTKPIIVKRIKKVAGGHHGGAWKIAYADFVTAMMAFFLLMWLLGSTSKATLEGISEYFKMPLKVALQGGPSVAASDSVLKGGGKDLTKKQAQVKPVDGPKGKQKEVDIKDAKTALEKAEQEKLAELKLKIEEAIDASATLSKFKKQLLIDITSEGLRIQIVDEQNRPMFASSKAELQPYAKQILHEIGSMLNDVPNKISLSGHTDAVPYPTGDKGYSNWELSSDRANASRRELVAGGMDESKLLRVVGLSSASLFDKENPLNPVNRRISIIIMNKKAEEDAVKDEGATVNVPSDNAASEVQKATEVQKAATGQ